MDILNYIVKLVITLMIVVPFLSFLFSWCCSIYYTRKTKYTADIAAGVAKVLSETVEKIQVKTNDPS